MRGGGPSWNSFILHNVDYSTNAFVLFLVVGIR